MKNIKFYYILFFLMIILTGCNKDTNDNIDVKEIVKDDSIIETLKNQTSVLVTLDSIKEAYKGNKVDYKEVNDYDKIKYSLTYRVSLGSLQVVDNNMIKLRKKYNLNSETEYVNISEISKHITSVFGSSSINYISINECPNYIYDSENKQYYINRNCIVKDNYVVTYYDDITKQDNKYYVEVHLGFVNKNKLYKDYKYNVLISNNILEVKDNIKNDLDKYTFTYTKNSNGNYIFTSVEKNK